MFEAAASPDSDGPVLAIDHLTVAYQTATSVRLAIDDISLSLADSEILGVVGESGCGKSTLGMTILRLLPPNGRITSGSIGLRGYGDLKALTGEQMRGVRGREIAIIFQDPTTSLNPRLPIGAQLVQVQQAHSDARDGVSTTRRQYTENAAAKLAEVGLPNPRRALERFPHEFSGGMRQRVMIAMALLFEPKMIIADEATSALDVTLEAQILELFLRLRETHGTAVLFISHDLGVVSQLCDRVAVMYAGRVVEELPGEAVLASPHHPYTQALQAAVPNRRSRGQRLAAIGGRVPDVVSSVEACSFAPRCIYTQPVCSTSAPELYPDGSARVRCFAYAPPPRELVSVVPSTDDWRRRSAGPAAFPDSHLPPADPDQPLVELVDLAVHCGGARTRRRGTPKPPVRAVDGVSLTLQRGRMLGIVGESGSGKTTLGEAVVKLLPATGGTIRFAGRDVTRMSTRETFAFRRRAQMIFQNPYSSLSPRMQVGQQLTEPYEIHRVPRSERRSVEDLLSAVDLPAGVRSAYPSQLSGGQARRVGIARALVLEPDLVVADEPTAGLDTSAAAATMNLLSDLRDRMGLTVILISHNLSLVTTCADEICVMYFGQVIERGDTATVTSAPAHPYTRALLALAPDPERSARLTRRRLLVPGEIPSPDAPPSGCRFHPRCAYAQDVCVQSMPALAAVAGDGAQGHVAACHFARESQAGLLTERGAPDAAPAGAAPAGAATAGAATAGAAPADAATADAAPG
ncbi:MAG: dipeptide ABC transporter ATP-binding protein [Acidimicrobiales bacterium]